MGATQAYCDAMKQQTTILGTGTYPPSCMWAAVFGYDPPTVGVPPAPPLDVWTVPPASGVDAQATVDTLLNQQLESQQAANAQNVQSSWLDSLASRAVAAGDVISAPFGISWLVWGALGLGVFGLVAIGSGGPRRYGR
jgi:hypothetical protein